MEFIVGHLGRLEFMTSGGTAFNRIGELVRLARLVVHRARSETPTGTSLQLSGNQSQVNKSLVALDESPDTRRDSTTGRLLNVRSMHEETTDVSDQSRRYFSLTYHSL
jgi:hypothetical protein